jgi:Zn finger protein HypA/HybF involved in hydrogenase expression
MTMQYKARNGNTQYKPSLAWIESADNEGFCLACGNTQTGIEPDAKKCKCDSCGAMKVYGNESLALMNLFHGEG